MVTCPKALLFKSNIMKKKKLLIATHNLAKLAEFKSLLASTDFELLSLADCGITYDVQETGSTIKENAILKATTYATLSGLPTLADDTGLEVDALDGEPGVYSARYAGPNKTDEEKIEFLLKKMESVPEGKRQAKFRCVVAFAQPGKKDVRLFTGQCPGEITTRIYSSGEPGFPYKRVFFVPELGKVLCDTTQKERDSINHRAHAIQNFVRSVS